MITYLFEFILIILFNLFQNVEIIIPFNSSLSKIPKNLTHRDFMDSLITNKLVTNINIGTPPQNFDFLLDFDSYLTSVLKEDNNNKKNKRFNENNSTTFNYLGEKEYFYNLNFFSAINASDLITINDEISNFNCTFLHICDFTPSTNTKFPGVIGLGVITNGQPIHEEAGLIYQFKQKKIINNYNYTLVFNKNDFNGKIIIEKNIYKNYSIEYFMKDYCIVTVSYNYYWGWNHVNSYLDSEPLEIKNLYFKPELGVIITNSEIKDILKEKFFDKKIKEGKCYEDYKIYTYFYCDKDVKINVGKFIFKKNKKGIEFYLDSKDLIIEYNNKIFFLMVFGRLSSDEAYFGYPFFKKFDVIFDQGTRNVGFYNITVNDNNKEVNEDKEKIYEKYENKNNIIKILFPFLIFICVLFGLYYLFYLYRKIKRKSNERLYEELNETTND